MCLQCRVYIALSAAPWLLFSQWVADVVIPPRLIFSSVQFARFSCSLGSLARFIVEVFIWRSSTFIIFVLLIPYKCNDWSLHQNCDLQIAIQVLIYCFCGNPCTRSLNQLCSHAVAAVPFYQFRAVSAVPCVATVRGCRVWLTCVAAVCDCRVWVPCVGAVCGYRAWVLWYQTRWRIWWRSIYIPHSNCDCDWCDRSTGRHEEKKYWTQKSASVS